MRPFALQLVLFTTLNASSAVAGCLDEVSAFAIKICGEIDKSGSHVVTDTNGNLDVYVSAIVRRIVGGGSATVSGAKLIDTYENVLREWGQNYSI